MENKYKCDVCGADVGFRGSLGISSEIWSLSGLGKNINTCSVGEKMRIIKQGTPPAKEIIHRFD